MVEAAPIPCVVYAAKSTEDRRGSIPGQLADCRIAVAQAAGRQVVAAYTDEAFSAYQRNRGPGLEEALQHAQDLAADGTPVELWTQHSDRLARGDGRRARHTVEIALWVLKKDVQVRTIQDPDTFRDLLYAVVTGQRNHEDSRRRGLAVQAGRKRAAARGEFIGYKPDGYQLNMHINARGELVKHMRLDTERQPLFETLFKLALRGERPMAIARRLNHDGWLTKPYFKAGVPRPWTPGRVVDVIRNPRYAGMAVFAGQIVARDCWPAYITERQHNRLRARIETRRPTIKPRQLETYLLARLAMCGRCGSRLYCLTGSPREDGTFSRRYLCASHRQWRNHDTCRDVALEADMVEAMLAANIRTLLFEPQPTAAALDAACRQELQEALAGDDDEKIAAALERAFATIRAASSAVSRSLFLRQRARDLGAVARLEAWAETERTGRTTTSRDQTRELNRVLRDWFSEIAITVDESAVAFAATRRTTSDAPTPAQSGVRVGLEEWVRLAPLARREQRRYRPWSKAEIVGALWAWADEHGRPPRWGELRRTREWCPTAGTILRHFGSWEAALAVCGLDPVQERPDGRKLHWTDDDIIRALQAWTAVNGRPPASGRWTAGAMDHPCRNTVSRRFGSWNAALHAAALVS